MQTLTVATYNIHKGFSHFNQRVVVHELRERLRELSADIVFLQEVQGAHNRHGQNFANYPDGAQHEFIADRRWPHSAYGKNCIYEAGHHGNAILSLFPIVRMINTDISAHRFESRGLLHCEIELNGQGEITTPDNETPRSLTPVPPLPKGEEYGSSLREFHVKEGKTVHCLCAHFGLFAKGRRAQTRALIDYVQHEIPPDAPVIIAGDFNDWRNQMSTALARELGMHDVFNLHEGQVAKSFPARMPVFRLDRIYVRGFSVKHAEVHVGGAWQRLSDHAALSAVLSPDG